MNILAGVMGALGFLPGFLRSRRRPSRRYRQSLRDFIGQARTAADARERLRYAHVTGTNATSGTKRKWARTVERIAAAAAVLLIACSIGSVEVLAGSKQGPRVQFLVTPRTALCSPGRPVRLQATVLIENPGPEWYCPAVAFEWADGHTSRVESDCDPYETLSDGDRRWFRATRSMLYGPGEHTVSVRITQGARVMALNQTVDYR